MTIRTKPRAKDGKICLKPLEIISVALAAAILAALFAAVYFVSLNAKNRSAALSEAQEEWDSFCEAVSSESQTVTYLSPTEDSRLIAVTQGDLTESVFYLENSGYPYVFMAEGGELSEEDTELDADAAELSYEPANSAITLYIVTQNDP